MKSSQPILSSTLPVAAETRAVIFEQPGALSVRPVALPAPGPGEVLVDVHFSGISTGTERLLWRGDMPPFPGLEYPLVPGYESVGVIRQVGPGCRLEPGQMVFVPGANCYGDISGLFGGTASCLVTAEQRIRPVSERLGHKAVLLALSATAHHALTSGPHSQLPSLIVGHGVLGRLAARLVIALGGPAPIVWETNSDRRQGAEGYRCSAPGEEGPFKCILDASGAEGIIDELLPHLKPQGEIVLAGFYHAPVSFQYLTAFMKEAQFRVAAEWQPQDLDAVCQLINNQPELLDNLITHRLPAARAEEAYPIAFEDPSCLKMILDWTGAESQ
ncbi:MAG: chlorophyll synthesis pathway protein BchC [Pseudomonadota bacterium]